MSEVLLPPNPMRFHQPANSHGNWRGPLIRGALRVLHPETLRELDLIRSIELSPEKIRAVQRERLEALLRHAWTETDYYREVLEECGAVRNGRVNLDRFTEIPF